MNRQVRCVDTKQLADKDKSYKAADGKYYSSEAAYNFILKSNGWKTMSYNLFSDVCGFNIDGSHYLPPVCKKELKQYERFGWDCVYKTIYMMADDFKWAATHKTFNSEYALARYMGAIIGNNITTVKKGMLEKEKQEREAAKLVEQANADDMVMAQNNKKATDISSLLEDED